VAGKKREGRTIYTVKKMSGRKRTKWQLQRFKAPGKERKKEKEKRGVRYAFKEEYSTVYRGVHRQEKKDEKDRIVSIQKCYRCLSSKRIRKEKEQRENKGNIHC
jgi:hypothetical protein